MTGTHYDVLGVAHSASAGEIRKAWVSLARQHHPDLNSGPSRKAAEVAMREVNEAWHVLGDPGRRAGYDRDLLAGVRSSAPSHDGAEYGGWVPYSRLDDEDEIDPRLLSDAQVAGSKELPRSITLLPIATFAFGVFVLFCALLLNSRGVLALGAVIVACSMAGFVLMPLVVMSRAERDPHL